MGFKQTTIEFEAPKRHAGVSKFSMKKMLHFAMDGVITNSTIPLHLAFYIGILAALAGGSFMSFTAILPDPPFQAGPP